MIRYEQKVNARRDTAAILFYIRKAVLDSNALIEDELHWWIRGKYKYLYI